MQSKIFVTLEDMALLHALHRKSEVDKVEYMLMGGAAKTDGGFLITRLVCPTQQVSHGLVEATGAPTWLKDIQGCFPVWIHTHLCGAFWSHTDENTIQALTPARVDEKLKLTVSVVLGQDKFLGRVDIHSPLRITLDDLVVDVQHSPKITETADVKITGMFHGKTKPMPLYNYPIGYGYGRDNQGAYGPPTVHTYNPEGYEEVSQWDDYKKKRGFLV